MTDRILAADVGATKALVGWFERDGSSIRCVGGPRTFESGAFDSLEALIAAVRRDDPAPVAAAAFGVPGPIVDGRAQPVNLAWRAMTVDSVATACDTPHVLLLNDLEALANSVRFPEDLEIETLAPGIVRDGNIGVVAAGTGLGLGFLYFDGAEHRPVATEGGHTHFGPRDERETALLRFLLGDPAFNGHVSYERVVSGLGLYNLYRFMVDVEHREPAAAVVAALADAEPNERAGHIGRASSDGSCAVCRDVIDWFVTLYAAQAANQALVVMALGGVYLGGGIVAKHIDRFRGGFADAFFAKGRYESLMREIPVHAILNSDAALRGAARAAGALHG